MILNPKTYRSKVVNKILYLIHTHIAYKLVKFILQVAAFVY